VRSADGVYFSVSEFEKNPDIGLTRKETISRAIKQETDFA
jgi:hypothetical protein